MKSSTPLVLRLLALSALWPALTFGQDAAPADKAAAEARPAAETKPAALTYSAKGADTCLTCHEGPEVNDIFHTAHAQPNDARTPFGKGGLQCEACHGPGGNHAKRVKKGETRPSMITFGRTDVTPVGVQNKMCLGCHEQTAAANWHVGPHDTNNVSCAACHDSHKAKDAVLTRATQPEVCYTCHVAERSQFLKAYAHPVRQGKLACSDCHAPHGTTAQKQLVDRKSVV